MIPKGNYKALRKVKENLLKNSVFLCAFKIDLRKWAKMYEFAVNVERESRSKEDFPKKL